MENKEEKKIKAKIDPQTFGSIRVAIIGSAGREASEAKQMTPELFALMKECALKIMHDVFKLTNHKDIELVSGGSAFADHVAVALWLEQKDFAKLRLYLPCNFWKRQRTPQFADSHLSWKENPGGALNHYHHQFSKACKCDSLKELDQAMVQFWVNTEESPGFHARNSEVARNCDYLIAFTFGESTLYPKSAGTWDTWKKATSRVQKIHVPLLQLQKGTYVYPLLSKKRSLESQEEKKSDVSKKARTETE